MAKTKKISVNAFQKAMKETYNPTYTFDWNGIEVTVNKTLSLKDMLEFVDDVVKSCFTEETNRYLPEVKDFVIRVCILEKYANFTMPQNLENQYELVYCTDAVQQVMKYINPEQYNSIITSIENKINNIAQANIEAINQQMNKLFNSFDNLQDKLGGLFAGLNSDDITNLTKAIADGGLDNEKLVEVYMNKSRTPTEAV